MVGRTGEELRIAELGVDLLHLVGKLAELLAQARRLGIEVDDIGQRQDERRLVEHELHRAMRSFRRDIDGRKTRETLDEIAVALKPGEARLVRILDEERNFRA